MGMLRLARRGRWIGAIALCAAITALVLTGYAGLRPHRGYPPSPPPDLETWPAVADGRHNSNTDLIHWGGSFWLVHATAPWHFASTTTRLVLRRAANAHDWQIVREFASPGNDVRDPKLVAVGARLFLYWLRNRHFPEPQPFATMVSTSIDGRNWDPAREVTPEGWLLWRVRSRDGALYATAYWHEHGRAALLRSEDGRSFSLVSDIVVGSSADETDFEFLEDGRILATSRLEGKQHDAWFGDSEGATLLSVAAPPFTTWSGLRDRSARLDGPRLFSWKGRVYAVGRYEPVAGGWPFAPGSILARKRTALYLVEPARLVPLALLPSAGDTSYAGVALVDDWLVASYYTSRIDRDYPWLLGMLSRSEIRMARLPLATLDALASGAQGR
jgi:hypothetical protein